MINVFDKAYIEPEIDKEKITTLCIGENKIMTNTKKNYSYQLVLFDPISKKIIDIKRDRKKILFMKL